MEKPQQPLLKKISAGFQNVAAIGQNGKLYIWGNPTTGLIPHELDKKKII